MVTAKHYVMAVVVISEVLCFVVKNYKRLNKSSLIEVISKFYHEDELYGAKVDLNNHVSAATDDSTSAVMDGWSRMLNKQGHPIVRKGGDPSQRRTAEAEDILSMIPILDVHKVELPTYVAADLDRVPVLAGCWSNDNQMPTDVSKLTTTVEELCKRIQLMEARLVSCSGTLSSASTSVQQEFPPLSSSVSPPPVVGVAVQAPVLSNSSIQQHPSGNISASSTSTSGLAASRSWADQVNELANDAAGMKPRIRIRGKGPTSNIKAVPRRLTCFVGRLAPDVTEEELAGLLKDQEILDVKCTKITPRNGRIFNTSAFRVSCSATYETLFYDEGVWPEGVELRDWIFL